MLMKSPSSEKNLHIEWKIGRGVTTKNQIDTPLYVLKELLFVLSCTTLRQMNLFDEGSGTSHLKKESNEPSKRKETRGSMKLFAL